MLAFSLATLRVASLRAEALALDTEQGQAPTPTVVDSATVKVLTGLLAPEFQEEMNHMVQALGVTCYTCHQGEATPKLPPGQ